MARRWRDWPSLLLLLLLLHGVGEVRRHIDPLHRLLALHSHTRDVTSDLLCLLGSLPLPIPHVPKSVRLPRSRLLGLRVLKGHNRHGVVCAPPVSSPPVAPRAPAAAWQCCPAPP